MARNVFSIFVTCNAVPLWRNVIFSAKKMCFTEKKNVIFFFKYLKNKHISIYFWKWYFIEPRKIYVISKLGKNDMGFAMWNLPKRVIFGD